TFDVGYSGAGVFVSEMTAYAARVAYYFPIALLVIGIVHYHAFRTMQALVLPLVTALLSVVWAVGLMGLTGVPLDPYNTTTPILILAVAAGHAGEGLEGFFEGDDPPRGGAEGLGSPLVVLGPRQIPAGGRPPPPSPPPPTPPP